MTAQDADATLGRAIESVLSQSLEDVQLVLCVLPSQDRTLSTCERWADRDIRVDVVTCATADQAVALDAGIDAARGAYVLLMGQRDWLGTGMLAELYQLTANHDLQLACAALAVDGTSATFGRSLRAADPSAAVLSGRAAVREQAYRFIEDDAFGTLRGKMLVRDRIAGLGLRMALALDEESFLVTYLEDVERVGIQERVCYHLYVDEEALQGDRGDYERCERDHAHLLDLVRHWGMTDSVPLLQAVHRRHMRHVIACISRVCSLRSVSSIERADRVRDMIEAPSTQETIRVLQGSDRVHRDFGLMFEPIARKNVTACCLSARVSDLIRMPRVPFVSRNAAVL